ncbi:PAS domain S-box protein [Roseospira marina]|uniref:histidine kinase n=1 Tax=Roseospira marina TaxID=140057 RepID=A0A5M6IGP4_9PROT|nr:PAS domain S-box protein [Roseospira marina]KAA5606929.1 PAS domain S-box protein [Roseospira marina]MBB4312898.1 PAS domain S-box-containing protein [Roseospira marina]MBB5086329.1 PAS domain S-box-containing protein [Roseospira marina]
MTKSNEELRVSEELRAEVANLRARLKTRDMELASFRDQRYALETALEDLATHQEELRAQNEELRAARQFNEALVSRYASLFDGAPVGYCIISDRRAIISANRRAAEMFEAAVSDVEHKPIHLFIHPDSHAILSRHLDKVLAGQAATDEIRVMGRDGRELDCLVQSQPNTDRDSDEALTPGELSGLVRSCLTTFNDISQRKQAERGLSDSELKFRNIFTLAPFGMMTLSQDGRLMETNEAARRMLGLSALELRGMTYTDLLAPDTTPTEAHRLADGQPRPGWVDVFERELRGRGDRRLMTRVTFSIMPSNDGQGVQGLVIIEDMTERRELETRFQHAAKLTLLGEMSASLAHEISQPLNIIRLKAEGALERLKRQGFDAARAKAGFAAIDEQVVRLFEVISYMQGLSRRDTGTVQPFSVSRAIQAARTLVDKQFRDDNIRLEVDDQLGSIEALGRQHQLEQVLVNILRNARDALLSSEGRRILAGETPRVKVSATPTEDGDRLAIVLTNNGPRVSDDVRQKMFDPFFTTKSGDQGTGLGLSISLAFINEMGGTLSAENTEEGLAFHLLLPRVRQARRPVPDEPSGDSPTGEPEAPDVVMPDDGDGGRPHVLVVDDEEEAAREIAGYLDAIGYRVTVALNGQQALEIHVTDPARAVITDLRMPERDGHWLIDRLRAGGRPVFIVIITGQAARSTKELDRLRQRADALLRKPASLRDIVRHLRAGIPARGESP